MNAFMSQFGICPIQNLELKMKILYRVSQNLIYKRIYCHLKFIMRCADAVEYLALPVQRPALTSKYVKRSSQYFLQGSYS